MAKHVIVGKGNLGMDIMLEAKKLGHSAVMLTQSAGFKFPESMPYVQELKPDYVWITSGAGSVEAAKKNFAQVVETHLTMPMKFLEMMPSHVNICLFSSDYVSDEDDPSNPNRCTQKPRSLYALSKLWMEQAVKMVGRPNTAVVRVGSLYGAHFPERGLPGKLHSRFPTPCEVQLPLNYVVPTTTNWIAEVLLRNTTKLFTNTPTMHHCAPLGGTTVMSWGKRILGEGYTVNSKGFDYDRPLHSGLGCTLEVPPRWEDLWGSPWWQKPKEDHLAEL